MKYAISTPASLPAKALPTPAGSCGHTRQTVGFVLAPLLFLYVYLLPLGLTLAQQSVAASLAAVIVLWVTEALPIPVSGLLGIALMAFLGVDKASVIVAPFGSPIMIPSTVFPWKNRKRLIRSETRALAYD